VQIATEYANLAVERYRRLGDERGAARARAIIGRAYVDGRRFVEGREALTPALEVLQTDPDADTVTVLRQLALCEVMLAGPDRNELTERALVLGQALGVGPSLLAELFIDRAMSLTSADRLAEGIAALRYAAYVAEHADDGVSLGRAYATLADALMTSDPAAALEVARKGMEANRRVGARGRLGVATVNAGQALIWLGRWDEADALLSAAVRDEALAGNRDIMIGVAHLAALRGDVTAARQALPIETSDPQAEGYALTVEALIAAAVPRRPELVLEHAEAACEVARTMGVYTEIISWSWPLAARAATELGKAQRLEQVLGYLDRYPRGQIPSLLQAERQLAAARLALLGGPAEVDASFETAVAALRRVGSPYHLAHGLLDHAAFLLDVNADAAAQTLIDEARTIAERLGAQPILARIGALAGSPVHASPG
jgi:tetratricopeptide (TPR) repeat protein